MRGLTAVLRPVALAALLVVAGAAASPGSTKPLRVTVSGRGAVASVDGRMRCQESCSTAYRSGAVVVLRAAPGRDARFARWTGDCVGTAPRCPVVLDGAVDVGAVFIGEPVVVAVTAGGSGTVYSEPDGLACGLTRKRCVAAFERDSTVLLRALAEEGSVLRAWGGACAGVGTTSCDLSVSRSIEVTAAFEHSEPWAGPHQLSIVTEAHVSSEPPGVKCPPRCTAPFAAGALVRLEGAHRYTWDGGCVGSGTVCSLVADRPRRIAAGGLVPVLIQSGPRGAMAPAPAYEPVAGTAQYGVNVSVYGRGVVVGGRAIRCGGRTGSVFDCGGAYREGERVVLKALPGKRSRFVRWGEFCQGKKPRCTIFVTRPKIVTAIFLRHHE